MCDVAMKDTFSHSINQCVGHVIYSNDCIIKAWTISDIVVWVSLSAFGHLELISLLFFWNVEG